MKEFNCKVSSTWSNDNRTKDAAFTHRKHGDGGQEKVSQLDFFCIGPNDRHDECFIYNEGKLWDTWDHYHIYARIQEGRDAEQFLGRKKRHWCGWAPKTVDHMKKVIENDGHGVDGNLTTIQKNN